MHRQIHKSRKTSVKFFKKIRNLLESGFPTCQISPHWTWSIVKPGKAKTLNILGYNIWDPYNRIQASELKKSLGN